MSQFLCVFLHPVPEQRTSQPECPAKLAEFMDCCLLSDPDKRAKPQELLAHLEGNELALQKYKRSPPTSYDRSARPRTAFGAWVMRALDRWGL